MYQSFTVGKFMKVQIWYPRYFNLCKSNSCYDYEFKVVQKGLEKGGFNFSCDDTPD